ncbi:MULTISPECIES: hypothetical protein [unclassified Nostoc]|uniref:hypothetical protein n=1 Tax=unclassified Nostoc TaxID=2593658 RepID=UPI002AD21761|nr:hypothetical protein [Nostoc sp. DedQUE03]MDZ7973447.1 hypothetical protein [Nostoc sp. DedQUE03]MDZ8045063.1 hypothetical protein [Nostoc sp. DedQUE02]
MTKNSNNIAEPDPSWDYYITYHKLLKGKFHLDELIKYISKFEEASTETNEFFEKDLSTILRILESTLPKIETE